MNAMLWSIACEWQIYLLFAIVLVPLWRRAGLWAVLAVSTTVAALITEAYARGWCVYFLPWMIPIFGIGAAGATVVFGAGPRAAAMRRLPWGAISSAAGAMMCVGIALLDAGVPAESMQMPVQYYHVTERFRWIYDILAAIAAASLIVWLALAWRDRDASAGMATRIRGLLESRWLQGLGRFSYSLYLTHGIVLVCVARATQWLWPHWLMHWMAVMIGGTLLSLTLAYVFHLCFERRFMGTTSGGVFSRRGSSPSDAADWVAAAHSRSSGH
jgi:peptidoglycan/LPS O-acetylase OafA/YrhL